MLLERHGTLPHQIRDFVQGFRVTETDFGPRYHNQGGVERVLAGLRDQTSFTNSVFHLNPRVAGVVRKMVENLLHNSNREARAHKRRRIANTHLIPIREPAIGMTLNLCDLTYFLKDNSFKLPDGYLPRSDYADLSDYATHLGKSSANLSDIIFLQCPEMGELQDHLNTYGTHGLCGSKVTIITPEDYRKCQSCACFTSLLQIYGAMEARRNMKRLVRMTDGTFGHLHDRHTCLIVTGLVGTHSPKSGIINRRVWIDGYALCGHGESKWPTFVLTVALKKIWHRILGESDSLQADCICIDNSQSLKQGYLMSQKCHTRIPRDSETASNFERRHGAVATFIGCGWHRQDWARRNASTFFAGENPKANLRDAIDAYRIMNQCPSVESFKVIKASKISEWTDQNLLRWVEAFQKYSGDDSHLGLFNYGAAG